jgi:hypothetical protein
VWRGVIIQPKAGKTGGDFPAAQAAALTLPVSRKACKNKKRQCGALA